MAVGGGVFRRPTASWSWPSTTARTSPCGSRAAVRLLVGDSLPGDPAAVALLVIEPASRPAGAHERLWIADGALVLVRDRKSGASSRHHWFSANVRGVVDARTEPVIASARPVPGNTADATDWRDSGLVVSRPERPGLPCCRARRTAPNAEGQGPCRARLRSHEA